MALVTAPRNGVPIGWALINGQRVMVEVHPEYLRYFESLVQRVGGVSGSGTDDLALSQFEDAGIEEQKLALYRLADDLWQLPACVDAPAYDDLTPPPAQMLAAEDLGPSIEELRAQVAELTKAVQALQQGMTA